MVQKTFSHAIVVFNPASTNTKRLKRRIEELKQLLGPDAITIIKTSTEGNKSNRRQILAHKELLGPETLVCIAAGDGTVNMVIDTLLSEPSLTSKMQSSPVLPLWGGNANDLAHMLNGYTSFNTLSAIFSKGKVIKINPLQITLTYNGQSQTKIAACYASFGATAYAANHINTPKHRKQRLVRVFKARLLSELHTITKAFISVPAFAIEEHGVHRKMYEYAMINGSRIAKIERIPIRLTDNAFYVVRINRKHPIVALYILQILRKRRFGRITSKKRSFIITEATWLQTDGEVIEIKAGTLADIELNPKPFYALSKRLRRA